MLQPRHLHAFRTSGNTPALEADKERVRQLAKLGVDGLDKVLQRQLG